MYWTGVDDLHEHLDVQARFLRESVPAYEQLLTLLSKKLSGSFGAKLDAVWQGRRFHSTYERPLLLQASLRDAALRDGSTHPLYAGVVDPGSPSAVTESALDSSLDDPRVWSSLAKRHVQTNETTRSVVWLWLAKLLAEHHAGAALSLNDVGASAGLNLVAERLPHPWLDANGDPLLTAEPPLRIVQRRAFDASPLDASNPDDARWLQACVWPGQTDRMQRLEAAIERCRVLSRQGRGIEMRTATATAVPSQLASEGTFSITYQTIVRDYIEPSEREEYSLGMKQWLAQRPRRNYWVELELPHDDAPPARSAALDVHVSDGGGLHTLRLARCHPHPSVLDVNDEAVRAVGDIVRDA